MKNIQPFGNFSGLNGSIDVNDASLWQGIQNNFTGNLDFARERAMQSREFEFNSAQAALNREFNAAEAEKARDFSSREAALSRAWSKEMSDTAYTRAVKDLRAAGLNPALAYGNGGASTPGAAVASSSAASGSAASGSSGTVHSAGRGFDVLANTTMRAISSAMAMLSQGYSVAVRSATARAIAEERTAQAAYYYNARRRRK